MYTRLISLSLMLLVTGCGGGSAAVKTPPPAPAPEPAPSKSMLISTSNTSEFLTAFTTAMQNANKVQVLRTLEMVADSAVSSPTTSTGSSNSYSTTYTQETSVDEHDIVKYDGKYLYIAPSSSHACCFVVEDGIAPLPADMAIWAPPTSQAREIRIVATDPANASARQVTTLPVKDNQYIEGMYHNDNRLSTIGTSAWYGTYGDNFKRVEMWANQFTEIGIYNTSDINNPSKVGTVSIEGSLLNTRRTARGIHVITRHSPNIEPYVYYPADDAQVAENKTLLQDIKVEDLLPKVSIDGQVSTLLKPEDCYFSNPNSPDYKKFNDYPTVTTVVTIDPTDASIVDSFCLMTYSDGIYIAEDDIVFTQNYWNDNSDNGVYIHQFSLVNSKHYEGSARVDGRLYTGGSGDFRISRYSNTLRLVTTQWMDDSEDNIDHTLYIFNTNATNESLSELAHLPNDSRPDEIGKPNEDLYGVRFLGNRAYFVTFERIDPLYVIDMTDSSDPYIAGALDIPGVSNFLHPINDKLLLGLGQSAERQVKLSLFDVSDINLPMLRSELIVAPELQWTNSEAEYDRHAFTYLAGENDDKFAIPVSGWDETAQQQRQQLHLFNLLGKSDAASASLSEQGVMEVNNLTEGEYPDYRNRAILHDDTIYYINGSRVYSAFWTSPQDQLGPQ